MESVRLMAERRAREAAAAAADRAAAAEERAAAAEASLVIYNGIEFVVELAVLCTCLSELEEEHMDLGDTVLRYQELLRRAREGPCRHCSEA